MIPDTKPAQVQTNYCSCRINFILHIVNSATELLKRMYCQKILHHLVITDTGPVISRNMVFLSLTSGKVAACLTAVEKEEERWEKKGGVEGRKFGTKLVEKLKPCRHNIEGGSATSNDKHNWLCAWNTFTLKVRQQSSSR